MTQHLRLPLVGVVTALVVLVACQGAAPTPTRTPTPTPTPINPQALVALSGERMVSLETFAFRVTHQGGGTALGGGLGLVMQEAEGVVARPDQLKLDLVGQSGGLVVKLSVISVAGATYMTNPFTGAWQAVDAGINPMGFFDPQHGIAAIMADLAEPVYVRQEPVEGGGQAHRLRGQLPSRALASLLGAVAAEETLETDIWLDAETLHLRRVVLRGQLTPAEKPGVVRTIVLSAFNEPVTIQPPI